MANVNINAPADQAPTMAPPTRTDDQILPHIRWHTNFFRAFTASSTIPSIYIHQFWDTVRYDKTVGCYKCQLDEQWFDLTKDTLKDALQITSVNNNQAFTSPPSSDALINFVNELRYLKLVRNLSNGLKGQGLQCYRFFEASSIDPILTMQRGSSKNSPNPSIHPLTTKRIWKHKFRPRPNSPLHLPNEEPVLGYLKFSAKGTKREVFGMPIPDIQGESYYQEYLEKVAKHQRYLGGETGSDPDSPALKPTKTAKKSKPTASKADPRPPVLKPASSKKTKPKPAPAKTQGKKRKLPTSSLRSVDESVAEDIPEKELRVDDEEADVQRALEESLKSIYDVPRGPLPPVVIREPESGKYQPLPEVPGKGKEKVTEEQVARDLLTLHTPKKKSLADRYVFQRRISTPTGSSGHDESSSLYAELGLTNSEEESDEGVSGTDAGVQGEGQAGPNPDAQDKGQAEPNPDEQAEGQARPNPSDAEASQPQPSPIVHVGSDLEHMDLDVADVSTQPHPEQMGEGFTVTAYPKVQENLKLTVEEHVILEEPASLTGTLSSLQHLTKDLSFGDLFFNDKPLEADNEKTTAETEAE
nr:E-beta-farnesene synthase [Tanacetum cinerariifolium]